MTPEEKKLRKKEYDKMYREKNKEKIGAYNRSPERKEQYRIDYEKRKKSGTLKEYYENNKDKIKEYYSREDVAERKIEYAKEYWGKNKERLSNQKKIYVELNKERLSLQKKQYREENKEKIREQKKLARERDKEKLKEKSRLYYEQNKERIKQKNRLYAQQNKDKLRETNRKYRSEKKSTDPFYKFKINIRKLILESVKRNGYSKKTKTHQILGCSFEEFRDHIEKQFETWMNWDNHGKYNGQLNFGWDFDHIIPHSSGETEEEIIKLNHYTNFQPLCSKFNRDIKRNKI